MPTTVNGRRLGVAENGKFSTKNTDPIYLGRLWNGSGTDDDGAAASWGAMRAAALLDGIPSEHFAPGGPASSARSIIQQDYFWAHRPPPAAYPGTSNHGWGIAVDIPFADAQAWLRRNAHRFGWSNDEGRRVGEAWHWRYVGGYKVKRDRLSGYPADEKRWVRELDRLRRTKKDPDRQRVLVRVMTERRKLIWHAAQVSGWSKLKRRERYGSLYARTA
jgi:hypothetical protein